MIGKASANVKIGFQKGKDKYSTQVKVCQKEEEKGEKIFYVNTCYLRIWVLFNISYTYF